MKWILVVLWMFECKIEVYISTFKSTAQLRSAHTWLFGFYTQLPCKSFTCLIPVIQCWTKWDAIGSSFYLWNGVSLTAVIYTGQFLKFNVSTECLVIYMIFLSNVKKTVSSSEWYNYKVRMSKKSSIITYSLIPPNELLSHRTSQTRLLN